MSDANRSAARSMIPHEAPHVEGYEVAGGTTVEDTGSGDTVWDWIGLATGGHALICMKAGAGPLPAVSLAVARALLRVSARYATDLGDLLQATNEAMALTAIPKLQQTVEVAALLPHDGGLEWACAGRLPGGVIRRDGAFEKLRAHGPPLGMMGGFNYRAEHHEVGVGDTAFTLSHASQGLFMGAADLLAELHGKPAGEIVGSLHQAIRKAQGEERVETTVLYVRRV